VSQRLPPAKCQRATDRAARAIERRQDAIARTLHQISAVLADQLLCQFLSAYRSLRVHPDKQTISETVGTSHSHQN
jgi:hypothetical protein